MNESNSDNSALYRNGILVLVLVSIALIVHNIFGQNGYLASRRQQKELQTLQQKIMQLKQENDQLDKENRALKSDPAAVERIAREQMHLAKPGEKIYTLADKPAANPPAAKGKLASPQP
ncbi:MAG: FtsB family cell division protein [Terriglobia bacterium]